MNAPPPPPVHHHRHCRHRQVVISAPSFQAHTHPSVTSPGAAVASEHLKISGRGPESGLGVYQTVEPTGLLTRKPNLMYQSAGLTRKSNAMYRSAMMVTQGNGTHAIRIEADFVCNV